MSDNEQRDLLIWGGAAGALVLVGAIWLYSTDERAAKAESLHDSYISYYEEQQDQRTALAKAEQVLEKQADQLAEEEAEAAGVAVFPGQRQNIPPEIMSSATLWRDGYFANGVEHSDAVTIVSSLNNRIRSRARSLGIPLPNALPLEREGAIDPGADGLPRSLQLARLTAFGMLAAQALDVGVQEILDISDSYGPSKWVDPTGTYASVCVGMHLIASYRSADLLVAELTQQRNGLALHQWKMVETDDGLFEVTVAVNLTFPNHEDWQLDKRQPAHETIDGRPEPRAASRDKATIERSGPHITTTSGPRSNYDVTPTGTGGPRR